MKHVKTIALLAAMTLMPTLAMATVLQAVQDAREQRVRIEREEQQIALELARELRQARADARDEVLFWFRVHPHERVFPKKEVDRMLNNGGYAPRVLEGLTGSRNPFFVDSPRGE